MLEGTADLHVHTRFSDGLASPVEIMEMGVRAGLSWISVTDHDTVAGLGEAKMEAGKIGIGFVPGVELSVEFRGQDFHVLGYEVDPEDPELMRLLTEIRESRAARATRIVGRLHALGVNLPMESVRRHVGVSGLIGRPHVAEALLSEGWVESFGEAFMRYLGKDAPAYVRKDPVEPRRALAVIRRAGGVSALAHPGAYDLDDSWQVFVREGLQGLETVHPKHTPEAVAGFRRLAERYHLVATGGSDYHGRGGAETPIGGVRVEASVVDEIQARKGERE